MYFKQLSLDTLNESNQWNMLNEEDNLTNFGRDIMNDPKTYADMISKYNPQTISNGETFQNGMDFINKAEKITKPFYDFLYHNGPRTHSDHLDAGPGSLWQQFMSFLSKTYQGVQNQGEQFVNDHRQGIDRTGGFIAGYLSKMGVDSIKNWLFPPEVQEAVKEPEKMSALAGAGIGAAVTAGVLGLIWLYKKWQKRGQVTDQDIQYAAKLNQMKPEDIPEEDKDKPIEA